MNKVCVKGQRIYFYRRPEPIPKSQVNFSKIEFDMDETWSSFLSVVAQFIQNGEPKNVQVKDGYCFVPPELEVGAFELCLRGDDGESVVASVNRLTFEVCEGFDPSGETPLPPSPDLYTQLIKEIDSGKKIAQSVREDADAGLFNGGWYTPSVTQTDENTLRMDFTPSKDDMPDAEHTNITLPSGGGGTSDHSKLSNRDAEDQHPMSAITGLEKALGDKQPTGNYLTSEQDPTVPKWAKQPQKPAYTAQEVGALPDTTHIPSTADDVHAEPAGAVSRHNVSDAAHSDIRLLIQGLTDRLNAMADSDDTTLDQLSEIVAYIKNNRGLISAITTSKVSVADIIDNLTTNVSNKPLSAAQGVALKALIDALDAVSIGAIPSPATASVGQTIRVSAVDDNGQPTEWEAADMASASAVTPELLYSGTAENVTSFQQDIDFKGHRNLVIVVSGTKGDAVISMDDGILHMDGNKFVFAYYSSFLSATSESAPKGCVVYTICRIGSDRCRVDFSKFAYYSNPFWEYLQASSSTQSSAKTCYMKSVASTMHEKISVSFSAPVPAVAVEVYGF